MRQIVMVLPLSAVLCLAAWGAGGGELKGDLAAVQGVWKRTAGEVNGKKLSGAELGQATLTIKGDAYTLKMGDQTRTGHLKFDATKKPHQLDIISGAGPNKGKSLLGIYELSGDTLRYCVAAPGKTRPTEFSAPASSGHSLYTYQREKK